MSGVDGVSGGGLSAEDYGLGPEWSMLPLRQTVLCRTCMRPLTWETRTEPGFKPRTGWYDDARSDPLVCFKAADYQHVPLTDREWAYYEAGVAAAEQRAERVEFVRGWRTYDDGSRSPVERWVRAADGDWVSLDSTRRTSGDIHMDLTDPAPREYDDGGPRVREAVERAERDAEVAEARVRHADKRCDMHASDCAAAERRVERVLASSEALMTELLDGERWENTLDDAWPAAGGRSQIVRALADEVCSVLNESFADVTIDGGAA